MKNVVIVILLVAAVALGVFVIQKNQKAAQAEAQRVAAEKELKNLQASKTEQEQAAAALREKLETAQAESAANAGAAAKLTVALTNQVTAAEATNAASSAAPMSSAPVTFTQSMGSGRAVLLPPPVDAEPIRFEPPDCMGGKAADNPDCRAPKS